MQNKIYLTHTIKTLTKGPNEATKLILTKPIWGNDKFYNLSQKS